MKCIISIIAEHADSESDVITLVQGFYDPQHEIDKLYDEKKRRLHLLFSGYISIFIKQISNDVALTIWNYFNCYNIKNYKFIKRLLYLFDVKNNGYNQEISHSAVILLRQITANCDPAISRLLVKEYDFINESRKILKFDSENSAKYWMISNIACDIPEIYDSDLMDIMVKTACPSISNQQELTRAASIADPVLLTIISITNEDKVKDIVLDNDLIKATIQFLQNIVEQDQTFADKIGIWALLGKILDLIEFVLSNDKCKDICIKQIKNINGLETLNRIQSGDTDFIIDHQISLRCQTLIALYFSSLNT